MVMFMDDWYAYLIGTHGAAMVRCACWQTQSLSTV